jgi:replicative DNA helicase
MTDAASLERLLPLNIEAECGVLGSIIIDPEALFQVIDFLHAEDFYRDAHRTIYEVMLELVNRRIPADFITICDVLERRNKLEEVGGASYITSLINQVPTSGNVLFYARIVERTAILRHLIGAAGQIAALAYQDEEEDVTQVVDRAEQLIFEIGQRANALGSEASLAELITDFMNELDQLAARRGTIVGVPSGFTDLDRLTCGFQRSDLIVLAARPSVGKTAMALSLVYNAAVHYGQRIGIFSLEMSQSQLVQRLVAIDTGINTHRLRTGMIEDDDWDVIVRATGTLSEAPVRIDGTSVLSPTQMRSRARRWVAEFGIDLIIVDYLQLMQPSDNTRQKRENRVLVIDEISRNLKLLARELNIPILVLAQLSRAVEARQSKVPQLSDLRECVVGSTRLIDAKTGKWKPIAEIQPGDEVLGLGEGQKIGRFAVEKVWSTGKKPVYRLTTHTGRQIIATANHPLLTASGWKPLGELRPHERIATALCLPEHGQEMPERADLCRFLGYMVGDGTYQKHRGVGFISSDPEAFEDAATIAVTHFPGITSHSHRCLGNAQEVYFSSIHANGYGKPYGNPLREWMRSLDIFGQKDATKHVPEWVFEAGRIGACEFLAGYLSSDGCVKRGTGSRQASWEIQFDTVSRQLANDIQALLLRIDVIASVNDGYTSSKATQPIYRVAVATSAHNLRCFAEQVHPRGKKGRLLREMIGSLPRHQTRPGVFALPLEVSAYLAHCVGGQASKVTTWQWAHGKRQVSRDTVAYWADKLATPMLAEWAESDLLWESIRSIESVGEEEVFDICVPVSANFLANGIVAHNSGGIENNADIVMFIYRDELYNPGTARRNVADIIVAKHRNGPTGSFCLRYDPQTSCFRDMDDETVAPLTPSPEEELEGETDDN